VKSGQLEWLPEGSQLTIASPAQPGEKPKTYTSFGQSQKKTSERPLGVKYEDITIARLGPGQVILLLCYSYIALLISSMMSFLQNISIKVFCSVRMVQESL
jgi:hypothetical protein